MQTLHDLDTPLFAAWRRGACAVNGWLATPAVLTTEIMVRSGYDALTVDLQHGMADYQSLCAMLAAIPVGRATPLVRVPWNDPAAIMRSLDAGALGIICPMIETAQDARQFVEACLYPPRGKRSFGPIRARLAYGDVYADDANRMILPLAMIETQAAVANLDAILDVPGLAGIYIGPADLGLAHGFTAKFDREEPEMVALIARIREAAQARGLRACLHCGSPAYAAGAARDGFDLVTIGSDARFVEAGAAASLAAFRAAAGSTG